MNSEILLKYQELANLYQSRCDANNERLKLISYTRFLCIIGLIPVWIYVKPFSIQTAIAVSIVLIIFFLFLVKKFISTEKQKHFYQHLAEINRNEIKAIHRDWTPFDAGNQFIDQHHDYSYDLDLFGNGSLFQFLNRTVTHSGKIQLASLLKESLRTPEEILERQTAIQELAGELNWRQHFMAIGMETAEQKNQNQIDQTIRTTIDLKSPKTIRLLRSFLPAITIVLIGLKITGILSSSFYLIPVFSQWIIFILYSKTISKFYRQFESQSKILSRYSEMLQQIESKSFSGSYLVKLKATLTNKNKSASQITFELKKILSELDYRQNILIGIVLNSVFLWDLRCISKLNNWQQNYGNDLHKWFEVISELDALNSLANCNFNHPEWVTPKTSQSEFLLKSIDIGHPLIDEKRSVANSFSLQDNEQIAIITGANMAGKSTFLRTIGVNLILASNGCKVCAHSFEFSPIRIFTNMRTSDNLMNDESYFYAELLRLQTMLNLIRNGEHLFVIVDEMLKGTNSVDKLNGSRELIRQLILLKTHGIVATHDLGLTELAKQHPQSIKNMCFEVQLLHEELSFDYKLTAGVTRTMNATFLMKKMGIIPN